MLSKADYTQQILNQVPAEARIEFDHAMQAWWQDIRPDSGFRLTYAGFKAFKDVGIEHYEFDVPPSTPARPIHFITLNKKLTCPYFLSLGKKPQIILFGSKEATMYSLYGDIERFVQSLSRY